MYIAAGGSVYTTVGRAQSIESGAVRSIGQKKLRNKDPHQKKKKKKVSFFWGFFMFLYCLQRSSFNGESSRRSRLPTSPSAAAVAPIPDCSVRRALHIRFSSFPNPHVYKQDTHTEGKRRKRGAAHASFPSLVCAAASPIRPATLPPLLCPDSNRNQ